MAGEVHRLSRAVAVYHVWLPASPPAVWPFISAPDGLNRWSSAAVQPVEPGDGRRVDTVGTLRQVVLPRPLPVITEVVQRADAPSRFVYRVVGSRAVRHHRGELTLAPDGAGTWLRWEVAMALPLPGGAALVQRLLRTDLEGSLRRLRAVVVGASREAQPAPGLHDEADDAEHAAARGTAARQRQLADEMRAAGDARHWFSRVYQYVTEEMVATCARGEVVHEAWALRLIPRFHELYEQSVAGTPEPHWRDAFERIAAAGGETASGPGPFWRALVAGARAHIEGDLPRVLAAVYAEHYRGRCDYERFRADYLLLAAPLQRAWARLAAEVPPRWFPPYLRAADRLLPPEAVEHLTAKRFFDPLAARRAAFARGRELAAADAGAPDADPAAPSAETPGT